MTKISSLTLIGSSSGRNAGDAAIIAGLMSSVDKAVGRKLVYEIPTYRPEFIKTSYVEDARPVSMLPWHGSVGMYGLPSLASVKRTDGILIFDNMLFDRAINNPLFNFMPAAKWLCKEGKKSGKFLACYDIGAGPVATDRGRKMLAEIGQMMDFISVRDEDSMSLLREIGVTRPIILTADAALSVASAPEGIVKRALAEVGISADEPILAINVNAYLNTWTDDASKPLTKEEFATIYARALDKIAAKLKVPLLFVCTQHHDIEITNLVRQRLTTRVKQAMITNEKLGHHEIKGIFGKVGLLFAMRLHASILCSSAGTPVCSLAFQKKVKSYFSVLGLSEYTLSFKEFSEDALVAHVLKAWENRAQIRKQLSTRIPELIEKADLAAEVIALVSSGVSAEEAVQQVQGTSSVSKVQNR